MSIDTVKRTFAKLEKEGYLLVGHFNKDPRDKTKWYTINEERLEKLYEEIENKKQQQAKKMLEQNAYQAMPNALGQNTPMEEGKMHQCIRAKSTNARGQIAPTITRDYYKEFNKDYNRYFIREFHPPSYPKLSTFKCMGGGKGGQ